MGALGGIASPAAGGFQNCALASSHSSDPAYGMTGVEEIRPGLFFVAASPAMRKVREQLERLAPVDVPVLFLGESGTGKEVAARTIHELSPRAGKTFLKVNCAALPGGLLESELFGYEAGAFTGAARSKSGKFELCNRGTIFLDEIGEIPPELQAKLLQVLQDKQFSRLGGTSTIQVDVRILAATNVDISEAIVSKRLRQDLYYRLNAFTIELPPLRERPTEIPELLRHFIRQFAATSGCAPLPVTRTLLETCLQHSWPGNLRELENFVKRYVVYEDEVFVLKELERDRELQSDPATAVTVESRRGGLKTLVRDQKAQIEMVEIARALDATGFNRKAASRLLNISYKSFLTKMHRYGLEPPAARLHRLPSLVSQIRPEWRGND
jgi:transcriptional regulator with PAS, ATPase and Fis domain